MENTRNVALSNIFDTNTGISYPKTF